MKRKTIFSLLMMAAVTVSAQVTLKGIGHNNRYEDGEQMKTQYLGWNSELQKAIFIVDNGIYGMTWNGTTLTTPAKDPAVVASEIKGNNEKEIWANNFNMMYGNSGAAYVNGKLVTVFSRDESSTVDEELFRVCKWDANTGDLLSNEIRPKRDHLESAGMSYNPIDGKVYGLFYMTGQQLPTEITDDPDYFEDQDADMTDGDAGYCLCTINLSTMKVTPITKGLYYYNFITFAINSEGRAFALTSGGSSAPEGEDGKQRDINNNLTGAQLWEFDLVVAVGEEGRSRVGTGLQERECPLVRLAVPVDDVADHEDGIGLLPGHLGDDVVEGFIVNVGQHDELVGAAHIRADPFVGRQFHQVLHSTRTSPEPRASARPSGSVTEPMRV